VPPSIGQVFEPVNLLETGPLVHGDRPAVERSDRERIALPYATGDGEVTAMLAALRQGGWLAPGALLAVERASRSGPVLWPAGFSSDRSCRYGEATFWYGLAAGP
jgi:hypothetical protein